MANDVDFRQVRQVSIIIAVCAVLLNAAFYFLSQAYYNDRAATHGVASPEAINATRIAFGIMTGAVGLAAIITQFAPRLLAHGLAGLVGVTALLGAYPAAAKDFHVVLPVALGLLGLLIIVLIYFSLTYKSRGAWSFLTATCAVGGLVTLFGATKIRNATDVSLYYALILPGVLVVATVMLMNLADDYAEPTER
jgi:hypothetical protein